MKTRQLFFDLDRTLWDFEANSKKALQVLYAELNLGDHIEHFNHFHHTYVRINADLWAKYGKGKISKSELREGRFARTLAHHSIENDEVVQLLSKGYIDLSPRQTALFPHAKEVLKALKDEGYQLHIVSNGFPEVQHIKLENSGLTEYFSEIMCSEDLGFSKPARGIFTEAQRRTNCKPEHAVMIGDDIRADIQGALSAGWQAIHFDPESRFKKEWNVKRIRSLGELPEVVSMLPFI